MRDPKRIDNILERLKDIWKTYPDLRLGQLILNVANDPLLYYIEDEELLNKMEELYLKKFYEQH